MCLPEESELPDPKTPKRLQLSLFFYLPSSLYIQVQVRFPSSNIQHHSTKTSSSTYTHNSSCWHFRKWSSKTNSTFQSLKMKEWTDLFFYEISPSEKLTLMWAEVLFPALYLVHTTSHYTIANKVDINLFCLLMQAIGISVCKKMNVPNDEISHPKDFTVLFFFYCLAVSYLSFCITGKPTVYEEILFLAWSKISTHRSDRSKIISLTTWPSHPTP